MNSTNHITANDNQRQAPTSYITIIRPDDAKRLLENNTLNRSISDRTVNAIARDMKNGDWVLNGESIKISTAGRLLDGQHRLSACIRADVPFKTLVIKGLPDYAMDTVDAGRKRTAGDVLRLHGYVNNSTLAAAARMIMRYKQYGIRMQSGSTGGYTNSEILAFIDANPVVVKCAQKAVQFNSVSGSLISPATAALIYYMFTQVDEEDAERFFNKLQTGADLDELNPILKLRNYLIGLRASKMSTRDTSYRTIVLAMKCWNKWRTGQPIANLRFSENEQIPELI